MSKLLERALKLAKGVKDSRDAEVIVIDGQILVSPQFLQDYYGVGRRTISLWQKRGLEPVYMKNGIITLFDLKAALSWHSSNIDQKASANAKGESGNRLESYPAMDAVDPSTIDITTASIETLDRLKAIEDLQGKRLKNAKERGDLVPAEDLDRAMTEQAVVHLTQYLDDREFLPPALAMKSEDFIRSFLDAHGEDRITNARSFLSKEYDLPDGFHKIIIDIINGKVNI